MLNAKQHNLKYFLARLEGLAPNVDASYRAQFDSKTFYNEENFAWYIGMNINFKVQDRNSFSKIFLKTDHVD